MSSTGKCNEADDATNEADDTNARLDLPSASRVTPTQNNTNRDSSPEHSVRANESDSSDSDSSTTFEVLNMLRRERYNKQAAALPDVLTKPQPKHKWIVANEILKRERGFSNKSHGEKGFESKTYGSLHCVQRLELMYKLEKHTGCVNGIGFNNDGSLLASCSDDLRLCLWDWAREKLLSAVATGHKSNVFNCKFLPLLGHIHVATCGRDGLVRLLELDSTGHLTNVQQVARHKRPSHKIALIAGSPHCFLSCGEDAAVFHYDIRQSRPGTRFLMVNKGDEPVPLYSISSHPLNETEFMVGGKDDMLRIFDRRLMKAPAVTYTPRSSRNQQIKYQIFITSAVYNFNGSEVLASYNDDFIYLWDRNNPTSTDFVHMYTGHRNKNTIKGVNFFGLRSEYVVSGSDDGYIYFWDKEAEAIVQWLQGDENECVNCIEPHPTVPVLASSGLDNDVKIWVPSYESEPDMSGLHSTVTQNFVGRDEDDDFGSVFQVILQNLYAYENSSSSNETDTETESNSSSS